MPSTPFPVPPPKISLPVQSETASLVSPTAMPVAANWEWYRTLLAVLTEGSLSAAARQLGMTQPTVGRHIAALEAAFGQVLFTRSHEGLRPTDAARALRGHAEAMAGTAAALEREASRGREAAGIVRVSASEVMAVEVLPALLMPLRRAYPGLVLELVASNRQQNLLNREADIAIRMAPPRQEALLARRVGRVELGLHAQADYLAEQGTPTTLEALARHALIGYDEEPAFLRPYRERFPIWRREAFSLRADSDLAQLALIRAGCGIGACQVNLARRGDRLQRVLPEACSFELDVWVSMHEDLRRSPLCKAVFDALAAGLAAYAGEET